MWGSQDLIRGTLVIVISSYQIIIVFHRLIAMSVAMLIVPYLPATNLLIHVGFVVAERVLYLPTSGWCLLFALGLSKMIVFRKNVSSV